ncbi:4-(cytidine 5'-diphospho)-2-C-methyl-D-erythritol kinase [Isoalcanivorax beigongshangi]|uniref:4-diphosphocytidyl-2-C-methyl-D-erythritol kinase n=1 Tax=Isoalcanivorax beigongshangi TaxID=3238810 RepID=A0ABV4AEY3_9GAMM
MTLTLPAPAKLNLFLHINGRRDDGYHLLQTLFVLLEHGDTLHLQPANDLQVHCPGLPGAMTDNLVYRAAKLLQAHTGTRQGAHIYVTKRLPAGGGLGGGSSDAATALLGLNRLWELGLSLDTLAQLGLELGADVPVFVRGHSAFAEGVGEQLTSVDVPEQWYLVVFPGVFVSTQEIFCDRELTRNTPPITVQAVLGAAPETQLGNDCEPVARRLFAEVDEALGWLERHVGTGRMTGTGACVYATVANWQKGAKLLAHLPPRWSGFVARSCNTSPLHRVLEDKG